MASKESVLKIIDILKSEDVSVPPEAIKLITKYEGKASKTYKDPVGKKTVGYGHLVKPGEKFDRELSDEEQRKLLAKDLEEAHRAVKRLVEVPLTRKQQAALISLVYNIGAGNFKKSTLLKKLNRGDYDGASDEFRKWDKARDASGKVKRLRGLTRRRREEAELFKQGIAEQRVEPLPGIPEDSLAFIEEDLPPFFPEGEGGSTDDLDLVFPVPMGLRPQRKKKEGV